MPPFQYPIRRLIVRSRDRSGETGSLNYRIALTFDRHIGSTAAEAPVKFQNDNTIRNTKLAASRLNEILQWYVLSDTEAGQGPDLNVIYVLSRNSYRDSFSLVFWGEVYCGEMSGLRDVWYWV